MIKRARRSGLCGANVLPKKTVTINLNYLYDWNSNWSFLTCLYFFPLINPEFVLAAAPWNPERAGRNAECLLHILWKVFSGMEGKEERKIKTSKQHQSLFFSFVVFIPQLKSLLWQIAHFNVEPEWHTHTHTTVEIQLLRWSPTNIERKTRFDKAVIYELWSC